MNPILTNEGTPTLEVCVDLISGTILQTVPVVLDPVPGSAGGELIVMGFHYFHTRYIALLPFKIEIYFQQNIKSTDHSNIKKSWCRFIY